MSNTDQGGSMEGPVSQTAPVNDPASARDVHIFGFLFLIFTIFIFYLLVATWPVLVPDPASPQLPAPSKCIPSSHFGSSASDRAIGRRICACC
jgi:hypothetical protein